MIPSLIFLLLHLLLLFLLFLLFLLLFLLPLLLLLLLPHRDRSASKGEGKKKGKPTSGLSHSLFSPDEENQDDLFSTPSPKVTKKEQKPQVS